MEARILSEMDAKAYLSLRVQAAREDRWELVPELRRELETFARDPAGLVARHAAEGTCLWGVHDDMSLAGMAAVSPRFTTRVIDHLWLWGLYVRPPYRGTPASRLLMQGVLAWCRREHPDQRLFAGLDAENRRARQFFERWGFHPPVDGLRSIGPSAPPPGQLLIECDPALTGEADADA